MCRRSASFCHRTDARCGDVQLGCGRTWPRALDCTCDSVQLGTKGSAKRQSARSVAYPRWKGFCSSHCDWLRRLACRARPTFVGRSCRRVPSHFLDQYGGSLACARRNSSSRGGRPDDARWRECGCVRPHCHVVDSIVWNLHRFDHCVGWVRRWMVGSNVLFAPSKKPQPFTSRVQRSEAGTPVTVIVTLVTPLIEAVFWCSDRRSSKQHGQCGRAG